MYALEHIPNRFNKYPRRITFALEPPRTAMGKIQRFRLRALLDARSGP